MHLFNENLFLEIQKIIIPRVDSYSKEQQKHSIELVKALISAKNSTIQKKFRFFLKLIQVFSYFVGFQKFEKLSYKKKIIVLNCFYHSPISLLRKGFWGLNTMCKLGAYGQSSIYNDIHYDQK